MSGRSGQRALLDHAFVLAGRGATGLLPVVITALASRAYGLEVMGQVATALAATYALVEVADAQSQRHVTRLVVGREARTNERDLAAFNGLRLLILLPGLVLTAAALMPLGQPALIALVLTAVWGLMVNTLYAEALAAGRFALLGLCPYVPLILLPVLVAALDAAGMGGMGGSFSGASRGAGTAGEAGNAGLAAATAVAAGGPWVPVIALHAARLAEAGALLARLPWPTIGLDRASLAAQWRQTRFLMLQTLMSAIQARLLIPLVLTLAGAAGAGLFSIGISLLSVLSLVAVALTVPAYRRLVAVAGLEDMAHPVDATDFRGEAAPRRVSPADGIRSMIRRTRGDLLLGIMASCAIAAGLVAATPALVRGIFHVDDPAAHQIVRIIVLGGLFEAPNVFAGAYYHAAFRDRQMFVLSTINVIGSWVLLVSGFAIGGLPGAALAFLASRVLGCLVLWTPLFGSGTTATSSL